SCAGMSKLSMKEQSGCRKLLRLLPLDDLFALKDTVTNRLIAVESTREAIEAIITYSQDAEELLKRKKVHRDVIFKYLATEGVAMPPNSDKQQLIRRTTEHWSSGEVGIESQSLNTGQGLKCISSAHGLVLVAVAGTIHRDNACLGVFENVFGLIRSPMDNNRWKLKSVNMKVEAQSAITDRQVPVITYDSKELLSLCD
uniref:Chromosome 3 open reading frame 38 n=1 Tax=Cyprinus carpio TaxID=7962 RepID=A0A8C2KV96_CYPCA